MTGPRPILEWQGSKGFRSVEIAWEGNVIVARRSSRHASDSAMQQAYILPEEPNAKEALQFLSWVREWIE